MCVRNRRAPRVLGQIRGIAFAGNIDDGAVRDLMDCLDIRLLRAMCRDATYSLRGIEPRVSIFELARKARVSRVTVRRRLAHWRADGFWKGLETFPNPDAFGTRFEMQPFLLEVEPDRRRLESALRETLRPMMVFQVESFYTPLLLSNGAAESARRQREFSKASQCRVLSLPFNMPFPSSRAPLNTRDWRIVRALRRGAEPDWSRAADEVGMTVRGLERRVDYLVRSNALFFHPLLDFRRLPGSIAWVGLLYGTECDAPALWAGIEQLYPEVLRQEPTYPVEYLVPPGGGPEPAGAITFLLPVASAATGDQLRRDFANIEGVVNALVGFPTQCWSDPAVLDAWVSAKIGAG